MTDGAGTNAVDGPCECKNNFREFLANQHRDVYHEAEKNELIAKGGTLVPDSPGQK